MFAKKTSRRSFLTVSAGTLAAGAIGVPAVAQAAPITIGVGSDPVFSSFFVAAHEKIFEAEKSGAVLQLFQDGGAGMNALVAGQVDVASASEPTNLVRMKRAEIRPLAIVHQSGKYIKLVLGKGIADPKQIKRFGVVPGTVSEYCTGLAIQSLGLNAGEIRMVTSGPPELPALLARGDIDAFFVWEPWPSMGVQQGGRIVMNSSAVGYVDTLWLTATAGALQKNPEGLRATLRALAKASAIVHANPKRAAEAVRAITRIPEETTLKALTDMNPVVRDFAPEDIKSYDAIAQFLADKKVTEGVVPFRDVMQVGFYKG